MMKCPTAYGWGGDRAGLESQVKRTLWQGEIVRTNLPREHRVKNAEKRTFGDITRHSRALLVHRSGLRRLAFYLQKLQFWAGR